VNSTTQQLQPRSSRLGEFLRGDVAAMEAWLERFDTRRLIFCIAVIALGSGAFGATVGVWRSPLQSFYTAAKLPLIILLTTLGNGLLNGMLAPLLGLNLRFGQSLLAVLMSHTVAASILGSLSPVMLFIAWNAPPLGGAGPGTNDGFAIVQFTNVVIVALAGVVGNVRLLQLLARFSSGSFAALRVLLAWLAGNLFLGAQLAWNFRPFIGTPHLPVEFLRADAFEGNFYESVARSFLRLFN